MCKVKSPWGPLDGPSRSLKWLKYQVFFKQVAYETIEGDVPWGGVADASSRLRDFDGQYVKAGAHWFGGGGLRVRDVCLCGSFACVDACPVTKTLEARVSINHSGTLLDCHRGQDSRTH